MRTRHGTYRDMARAAGISPEHLGHLMAGRRRPTWKTAKKLAAATWTEPVWWMDATAEMMRAAIDEILGKAA